MNILDRVEQRIEQVMEGGIGRLFRSPVQPAEIGRRLERAMSERPLATVRGKLVPNDFRVGLHPGDLASFAEYQSALQRQLESWLEEVARRRGYTMVDRIRVELVANAALSRRAIAVSGTIIDRRGAGDAEQRESGRSSARDVETRHGQSGYPRLRFLSGPQRRLESVVWQPRTTIGRDPSNDLVLDVGDVSRHHARLELADGELRVVDLDSTNGTRVNGQPVRTALLRPGDEVSFGTIRAQVVAGE